MSDYTAILAAATQLSLPEQVQLIEELRCSVPTELSEEWVSEVQRRSKELDEGLVSTIPWDSIRDAALRSVGVDSAS